MLPLFLFTILLACSDGSNLRGSDDDVFGEFKLFKDRFSKIYVSDNELNSRFEIFRYNMKAIVEHNAVKGQNFTLGVNQFTDLTAEEFRSLYINSGFKRAAASWVLWLQDVYFCCDFCPRFSGLATKGSRYFC